MTIGQFQNVDFFHESYRSRLPQTDQSHLGPDQEQEPEYQDGLARGVPVRAGRVSSGSRQNAESSNVSTNQTLRQEKV